MAITATTSQTELRSSFIRMDAEFFRPEHRTAYKRLDGINGRERLGHLCEKVTQGSNPVFSENGLPCVNGKNVYFGTMRAGEPNYVSAHEFKRFDAYRVRPDDILITLKHATKIGRAWIVEDDKPRIFARNVGLIRLSIHSPVRASVLLLYLWTRLGQLCLDRCATGGTSGQITLPISELKRLPVPPFQEQSQRLIDDMFQRSRTAAYSAERAYIQAKELLESELGLSRLNFQKPLGYVAQFSELEKARRLDPEHYYPAFRNLIDHLPAGVKLSQLSRHLTFCQRGQQPSYTSRGFPVINSKHVQPNSVILNGNRKAIVNPIHDLQIRYGDILVNGTGRGTLGRAAPYLYQSEAVPDNHVTILRSSDLDPVFVSFYLNSLAGQLQVEMHQRGTSGQIELYPFDIRKFLIWEAPNTFQKELRSLYDRAAASERTSKDLLEKAKTRVEQLIEEAVKS